MASTTIKLIVAINKQLIPNWTAKERKRSTSQTVYINMQNDSQFDTSDIQYALYVIITIENSINSRPNLVKRLSRAGSDRKDSMNEEKGVPKRFKPKFMAQPLLVDL
jgi:hypothetical protein